MDSKKYTFDIEILDPDLRAQFEDLLLSKPMYQRCQSREEAPLDLMIYELGNNLDEDFQYIESIIKEQQAREIFLTSKSSDPSLLLRAMRIGGREFFSTPITTEEIQEALGRFEERIKAIRESTTERSCRIINVLGGKGGCGTTSVAVNLATALAESNPVNSVALIDLNMMYGEIPLFLGIEPDYHWGEVTKNISRLDSTFLMNVLTQYKSTGLYVLPSPSSLNGQDTMATPQGMENLLRVLRKVFDFVIIDGGQRMNEIAFKAIEMSDYVFLISVLSIPCLANVNKLMNTFKQFGYPDIDNVRVIINRYDKQTGISLKEAELAVRKKIYWNIPNDYNTTISAINNGEPFLHLTNRSSISKNIRQLAEHVLIDAGMSDTADKKSNRWWQRASKAR